MARTITTSPSSSGWRSDSRASRENSASSSRKSSPRWASVSSPGRGGRAAPDQPRGRDRVVRVAERPAPRVIAGRDAAPQALATRIASIASGSDSGGRIEGRRRAAIDLPGAGRPGHQQAVPARGRDLQRPAQPRLAADVGQVGSLAGVQPRGQAPAVGVGPGPSGVPSDRELPKPGQTDHLHPARARSVRRASALQRRLGRVLGGHRDPARARPGGRASAIGSAPGTRADRAVERQLPGQAKSIERGGRDLPGRGEQARRRSRGRSPAPPSAGSPARG